MLQSLDTTLAALADPTRRAILSYLVEGDASVGDLSARFPISQPAVSRHLRVLEEAQLIQRRVDRQRRMCSLRAERLREVAEWVEHYRVFWEQKLDRLEAVLQQTQSRQSRPRQSRQGRKR
jgi:DNA-binding transcriptional ArsR family regulator